ncbi:MAG: ComEC/Rec2 family competence protein [Candidatus Taylorbacteria bacterium]|nr:ComEC/Rec2 family competence protein [Candidatus Taylorbacteria bacterium]
MQFRKLSIIHLVILLCLSVFAFSTYGIASQKDGLLKVYFFDIGQGDAIFIETPSGFQLLIDGGPGNKVLSKLGEVMPFWDKDIDVVVASHPHADHIVGLMDVLERYEVKNIIEAKESYSSSEFKAWEEAVKNENANNIEAIAGKVVELGDGVTLTILHPFKSVAGDNPKNPHDDVVVAMLKYGELEVMLTGDMETKVERRLILEGYDLDSDVLKIAHHGSKTSTMEEFLSAVSPDVAVIQVGAKNRYGHPTPEVLNRLENFGIKYYRNDINGDIKLVSDGLNYQILTY